VEERPDAAADREPDRENPLLHARILERPAVDRLVACIPVELLDHRASLLVAGPEVRRPRSRLVDLSKSRAKLALKDFAAGPFAFDFTNSAFDWNPVGGSTPIRFVASMAGRTPR